VKRWARPWLAWPALGVVVLVLIAILAPPLVGGPFVGNDFPNSLAFASWIARSFPLVPFWFPYEGAGVSPSSGYAVGPLWALAGILRAGLDPAAALRLLLFAAFASAALGVAAMARAFGLPRWSAVLAGVFFLLPPATWNLVLSVGLLGHITVPALAPWAIAASVWYLRADGAWLSRAAVGSFAAAAALGAATFVAHPAFAPITLALGMPSALGARFDPRRFLTLAIAALALALGALVAFVDYNRVASVAAAYADPANVSEASVPVEVLLGLTPVPSNISQYYGVSFTPVLLGLSMIGAVVALRRSPLRVFAVAYAVALAYLFVQPLQQLALYRFPSLGPLFSVRPWLVFALIAEPVLAASSVAWIARLVASRPAQVAVLATTAALLIASEMPGYGYLPAGAPLPLRDRVAGWSEEIAAPTRIDYDTNRARAVGAHLEEIGVRADVSIARGDLYRGLPTVSAARILASYTYTLPLFYESLSNAQQAFYLPNAFGVAGGNVSEVAAWFGVSGVVLASAEDRTRFQRDGWTVHEGEGVFFADAPIRRSLAAFREQGIVLHLGSQAADAYRGAFRLGWAGALPFDRGWLIEGPECVDDLSAAQLALVDVLVLDGACEREHVRASALVQNYVERGGRLYVETGWESSQFATTRDAPLYLPAPTFTFRGVGLTPSISVDGSVIGATSVDALRFGDFRYQGGTWNVSAPAEPLREWARPVVLAGGTPLVAAGAIGSGRVVWSGMNLATHARAKDNQDERQLYGAALSWLLDGVSTPPVELALADLRDDGATMRAPTTGWLLWRESPAYATFSLPVVERWTAGPGLLLARVTSATYRVEQHPSASMTASAIVGGTAVALLIVWAALGLARGGAADPAGAFSRLGRLIPARRARPNQADDEEY
jgi:hypothetical protein